MKYEFFEFFEYFPIFHHFQYFFAVENEEVSIFVFLFDVLKFRLLYSRLDEWAGWSGGAKGVGLRRGGVGRRACRLLGISLLLCTWWGPGGHGARWVAPAHPHPGLGSLGCVDRRGSSAFEPPALECRVGLKVGILASLRRRFFSGFSIPRSLESGKWSDSYVSPEFQRGFYEDAGGSEEESQLFSI